MSHFFKKIIGNAYIVENKKLNEETMQGSLRVWGATITGEAKLAPDILDHRLPHKN